PPGVVSSLRGRRIVSSRSPDYPPGFARSLSPHVVIARIGVDARGNIRQLMLLNSTGVRALDTRALKHIRGWKFTAADDIDKEGLEWGLLKVPFVTR
ncbi:MAG: energy transducer TonB, partial [Thermoplasmata archaeon]|nr:energy transducer TonB [Thermoplasmata archaeon]